LGLVGSDLAVSSGLASKGPEGQRRAARCQACTVRQGALFGGLSDCELEAISGLVPDQIYRAGMPLYHAEDEPGTLFIVRSGLIKLETVLPDGSYRIVRLVRRADLLALEGFLGRPCDHTAVALADAEVCKVPWSVVQDVVAKSPGLLTQILRHWHQTVQKADGWLAHYGQGTARQRMARFLLDLGDMASGGVNDPAAIGRDWPEQDHDHDPTLVTLPSRDDVGAILGITKETSSRLIADFFRAGTLTRLSGTRARMDRAALEALL
jgi:CRP-like cAMP-binding protein